MSRRVLSSVMLAGVASLAVTSAAQAATTYTVDAAAADGCSTANVCKTVTQANAKATDGDTVSIKKGTYGEPTITVLKKVTFSAADPGQVTVTGTGTGGAATFVLGDGSAAATGAKLSGLTIGVGPTGGPAVLVEASGTTVEGCLLTRIGATTDMPTYAVDDSGTGFADGSSTVSGSFVFGLPTLASAGSAPAVQGGTRTTLLLQDTGVFSGDKSGPAVALQGNANPSGGPSPNLLTRGSFYALNPASDGVTIASGNQSAPGKALTIDSALVVGGTSAASVHASSAASAVPLVASQAGNVMVTLHHATLAGAGKPVIVGALANGGGSIAVTADHSILHGAGASTVTNTPAFGMAPLGTAANTASLTITDSDATDASGGTAAAKTTVTGGQKTADAALFADPAKLDYHVKPGSAVIDKGGPQVTGESPMDFEGEPRVTGAATDLGADEYLNKAPVAALKVSATQVKVGDAVTFDLSGSTDPGAGGAVTGYLFDFGDGTPGQSGAMPTATHAFAAPGTYTVTAAVMDGPGQYGIASTQVTVTGGAGPTVAITTPKAGDALALFTTKVKRQTLKPLKRGGPKRRRTTTTRTLKRISFAGTASAPASVGSVELSLKRVSTSGKLLKAKTVKTTTLKARAAAAATCTFLDAKTNTFVGRACDKPLFFTVGLKDGGFAYTIKGTKYQAGAYELSARGTDKSGVVSTPVKTAFALR